MNQNICAGYSRRSVVCVASTNKAELKMQIFRETSTLPTYLSVYLSLYFFYSFSIRKMHEIENECVFRCWTIINPKKKNNFANVSEMFPQSCKWETKFPIPKRPIKNHSLTLSKHTKVVATRIPFNITIFHNQLLFTFLKRRIKILLGMFKLL